MTDQPVETRLKPYVVKQIETYDLALPIAKELAANYSLTPESEELMRQLNTLMDEAKRIEQQSSDLRKTWKNQNVAGPPSELNVLYDRLRLQVTTLIKYSHEVEKLALECKNNLMPKMSQHIQHRRSREAYQQRQV